MVHSLTLLHEPQPTGSRRHPRRTPPETGKIVGGIDAASGHITRLRFASSSHRPEGVLVIYLLIVLLLAALAVAAYLLWKSRQQPTT